MYQAIPLARPETPLLDQICNPSQLRALPVEALPQLADELRHFLLYSVGQTGGHFGAGLGVVELTCALHYLLDTPDDHLIWDVGHQSYPHKILTERREQLLQIRQREGLHPFPDRAESRFDDFGTGHSSTSISAALGMAVADQLRGEPRHSVAVIGDGALTAGMAFEALNHASHTSANLLVILNDNDMSISHNEGGLAKYLAKNLKHSTDGETTAALFEALAFDYHGPVDGHNFAALLPALQKALTTQGPQFLHVITQKGKGYGPAEADPVGYHAITKIEPINQLKKAKLPTYANTFGQWLCRAAEHEQQLVAITPAMREGSDLIAFSKRFAERYFDVAIAEQHSLTFAAGLACGGAKPVVAIYSTFLQRAYDQLVHDIAIQNLDVLLAVDRAGLVGEDGATHSGNYDIAALRCIPGMLLMAPSDQGELCRMLTTGLNYPGPAAVRYPRGPGPEFELVDSSLEIGKANLLRRGNSGIALLNFGPLLHSLKPLAEQFDASLVDMRFIKPLDSQLISQLSDSHQHFVTVEDHAIAGGAGSAVLELLANQQSAAKVHILGIPDQYIAHGSRSEQLKDCGLDADSIAAKLASLSQNSR